MAITPQYQLHLDHPRDGEMTRTFTNLCPLANYLRELTTDKKHKFSDKGHTLQVGKLTITSDFNMRKPMRTEPKMAQFLGIPDILVTRSAEEHSLERKKSACGPIVDAMNNPAVTMRMPDPSDVEPAKPGTKKAARTMGLVTLADLCKELEIDPAKARRQLRSAAKKNPALKANGWNWDAESNEYAEVKDILGG